MVVLNKLAAVLIVVFVVSLIALLAELFCVLRRRRIFRRQSLDDENLAGNSFYSPSKELLYFFCWKNQSRIEPQEAHPPPLPPLNASPPQQSVETTEIDDVLKWQALYGSSRLLFTIKEEDREGVDSENNCSSSDKPVSTKKRVGVATTSFEAVVAVTVEVEVDEEATTPFSTPCASPPYFTPSASPAREMENPRRPCVWGYDEISGFEAKRVRKLSDDDNVVSDDDKVPFVSIDLNGDV
jgi:hypothetical protein|uniref:Uncharacterized protein n=1 Tax=Fagus sylvatica TaxID=28930 RepID=A0A2N9GAX3_FAGSY